MDYFYGHLIDENRAELTESDSTHSTKVMRLKMGDKISFTDGLGHLYLGRIDGMGKRTSVQIEEKKFFDPPSYELNLVVSPTKNINRVELMLEKATELGINSFQIIWSENSERKKVREDRLQKIAIAAMKQSQKVYLPKVSVSGKLKDHQSKAQQKFIGHCHPEFQREYLPDLINPGQSYEMLVGPEGDFSPEEVEWAINKGYQSVHIGPNRLRTETAGIYIAALFYHLHMGS